MWNIMIVEDQSIVRQGLKLMLEQNQQFQVTCEASNGKEAIQMLENHIIDLILMDIRMPVMNGLEATRLIKRDWPNIKVLILTTFNDDEYVIQALKDGASGFLLKSADHHKLIGAVYSCMQGGMSIHEEVAAKVVPKLINQTYHKEKHPVIASLSPRETEIIKLVSEGKTNKEIATQLYLSVGTIKNHLTHILQKLELRDRTQLAIFAIKNNII
jgi:DNA-binding NarL/FixJ family response regulator